MLHEMMVDEFEKTILYISTPIYILLIGGEFLLSNIQHLKLYKTKDTFANVYLMLANMAVDLVMRTISLTVLIFCFEHRLFSWESTSTWYYWTLLFFLEDFAYYWLHRIDHVVRFFWAVHVTHHSSPEFNLTTGFRSSVFQPVYRFIWFIPIALAGFEPVNIFVMYSITQIYGILVHTKVVRKLGFLEKILVTPSHHRVHHASNVEYLDKNMGMCLIIWDIWFGTFQEELDTVPIEFGLYGKEIQRDPFHVIFHEWIALVKDVKHTKGLRNKWNYIFQPPGWSQDGSTLTSDQLRKQLKQKAEIS